MSEGLNYDNFPPLKNIQEQRRNLGLEQLDVDLLRRQAGSQDPALSGKAKLELHRKWELAPSKDARNAPTVDLMKQLENYSEEERKIMFSQLAGIQLTEGCNGNCYFCYTGKKKGVEAKYSFDSVTAFLKKYESLFPASVGLYWDSDPFDYREGVHNFTDIYKAWREIRSKEFQYISTAMPRGGEEDFIDFIEYAISEHSRKKDVVLTVRVSVAKHNIERVEAVFNKLTEDLAKNGFSDKEINNFYDACVEIEGRFKIYKVGPLINGQEHIRDVQTPACRDGVIVSPRALKAIMMVVPTIFEPSGEKDVELVSGKVNERTPANVKDWDYSGFPLTTSLLSERIKGGYVMLPPIKIYSGEEYKLANGVDDLTLGLGRETVSVGKLIIDLTKLPLLTKNESLAQSYLKTTASVFLERRKRTEGLIKAAESLVSNGKLIKAETEKIKFYILLTKTYLAEMDFLVRQIEDGQPIETITAVATVFRQVGRNQVAELPKIINGLTEIKGRTANLEFTIESIPKVRAMLFEILGQPFGLANMRTEDLPDWYVTLEATYLLKIGSDSLRTDRPVNK